MHGYIRHIPVGEDAIPGESAWARCSVPVNVYQNGAFWPTPLGWYAATVAHADADFAAEMLADFLQHTRENAQKGTPFEWMNDTGEEFSGLRYGTSGVLPYVGALQFLQ